MTVYESEMLAQFALLNYLPVVPREYLPRDVKQYISHVGLLKLNAL